MSARKVFPLISAAAVLLAGCCATSDPGGGEEGPHVHEMGEIASYVDTLKVSVEDCTTFMGRRLAAAERAKIETALARSRTDPSVRVPTVEEIPAPREGKIYLAVEVKIENVHSRDVPRGKPRLFTLVREGAVGEKKPKAVLPETRTYFADRSGKRLTLLRPYRLPPGQAVQGWVVFQADKKVNDWVLRFGTGAGALYFHVEPE